MKNPQFLWLQKPKFSLFLKAKTVVLAVVVSLLLSTLSQAAPKPDLWDRWQAHDPSSVISVDHSSWDTLLSKYVYPFEDGQYRVAYKTVHKMDRDEIDAYIRLLAGTPVSTLNKDEQLAYWINLYNVLTVQVILEAYPVPSIRDIDISPGLFSNGPWGKKLVTIEGEGVSLNDIEHRILRPIWKDPRLHYALNCASIGCPNLGMQAVTASTNDDYLNEAARAFINHPRAVRINSGKVYASSIYKWFVEDFGGSEAGVLQHLRLYAEAPLIQDLEGRTSIKRYKYDWTLNGVEPTIAQKVEQRGS